MLPPNFEMTPDYTFSSNIVVQMNAASFGEVKLRSKDPKMLPLIDPKFLSNSYDKETLVAAIRTNMLLMKTKTMREHYVAPIHAPKSDSEEDIMVFQNGP